MADWCTTLTLLGHLPSSLTPGKLVGSAALVSSLRFIAIDAWKGKILKISWNVSVEAKNSIDNPQYGALRRVQVYR